MPTKKSGVITLAREHFPSFLRSRHNALILDGWARGEQYDLEDVVGDFDSGHRAWGRPYSPKQEVTDEYEELGTKTPTPWAGLVITSVAQTAIVEGVRRAGANENLESWATWQANRMDAKQSGIVRSTVGLGTAYGIALPGTNPLTGGKMTKMLARSPKRMAAFYDDDDDEWCRFAIDAQKNFDRATGIWSGWTVRIYEDQVYHNLLVRGDGLTEDDWTYVDHVEHGLSVPPVARATNRLDLDGRASGEIEPILPLLRRLDQDMFDRLIVQRFGAWKVRYISGMAKPDSQTEQRLQAMHLSVEDLLVSTSKDTKFGTLEASDLGQFVGVTDADLRTLSAITQTPPHHLLGLSSNLQAEALAAAESGLQRKSADLKLQLGEFFEQMFRMTAQIDGRTKEASATDLQVRWRDTESRSLTQAADAMGKLAVQLKVPVEMLWEKLPGWTDSDTERAKKLVEDGSFEQLIAELTQDLEANAPAANAAPAKKPASGSDSK